MSIKFTGTANQSVDLAGRAFADSVEVDKSAGTLTLTGDFGAASLVLTDGNWTTSTFDVTINGNVTFNITDTINMGTGSLWTIAGNFDPYFAGITFNRQTSTIKMTGSGKTWWGGNADCLYNLIWIASGASITLTNTVQVYGSASNAIRIDGTFDLAGNGCICWTAAGVAVGASGVVDSTAAGHVRFKSNSVGVTQMLGTWNARLEIQQPKSMTLVAATYGDGTATKHCEVIFTQDTDKLILPASTTIFNMDFEVENTGAFVGTIDMDTNDASLNVTGNFAVVNSGAGSIVWDKGTGSITFSGTAAQSFTCIYTIEDVIINKSSNTLTLASDMVTDSITGTTGSFNASTYDITTTTSAIFDFSTLTMGTGNTWTVGTTFDCEDCTTVTTGTATLKLTGTGTFKTGLHYVFHLWVTSTATITVDDGYGQVGAETGTPTCLIDGTMILTDWLISAWKCQMTVSATANISGVSGLFINHPHTGGGMVAYSASATVTCTNLRFHYPMGTAVLIPADYSSITLTDVYVGNATAREIKLNSGTYSFFSLYFRETSSGTLHVNNVNNPDINVGRHFLVDGNGLTYTAGTGTITMDGSADQGYFSTSTHQIEDTVFAKTGGKVVYIWDDSTVGGNLDINGCVADFNNAKKSLTVWGDVTINATGTLLMGDATSYFNVYGNFDNSNSLTANITRNTGVLVMKGSGKTLQTEAVGGVGNYITSITIDTGASITQVNDTVRVYDGNLKVYGTLTLSTYLIPYYSAKTYLYSTGVINGAGYLYPYLPRNGCGILLLDGSLACANVYVNFHPTYPTAVFVAGDYTGLSGKFYFRSTYTSSDPTVYWTPSAGTYQFKNVEFRTYTGDGTFTIEGDTGNPNYEISGDFLVQNLAGGTVTWDAGSGTMTFNGSGAQTLTCPANMTYEAGRVDKSGGTLTAVCTNLGFANTFNLVNGSYSQTGGNLWTTHMTLAGSGTFTQNSSVYLTGNYHDSAHTGTQTMNAVQMYGAGATMTFRAPNSTIANLYIGNVYGVASTTMIAGHLYVGTALIVDGNGSSLTINAGKGFSMLNGSTLDLNTGGTITGAGYLHFWSAAGISDIGGTLSIATVRCYSTLAGAVFVPGTYECGEFIIISNGGGAHTFPFRAGDYVFSNGSLQFEAYGTASNTLTIDCTTYQPVTIDVAGDLIWDTLAGSNVNIVVNCSSRDVRWHIGGDVVDAKSGSGTVTWTKGTGYIYLDTDDNDSGTVDFLNQQTDTVIQGEWPSYYFNGTSAEFELDDPLPFPGGSSTAKWSIGGWIKPAGKLNAFDYEVIFATAVGNSNWINANNSLCLLMYQYDHATYPGKLRFAMKDGAGATMDFASTATFLFSTGNDRWRHIQVQRNNNNIYLYIDGVLDSTVSCAAVGAIDTSDHFSLGNFVGTTAAYWFHGYMREWSKWQSGKNSSPHDDSISIIHGGRENMDWSLILDSDDEWYNGLNTTNTNCVLDTGDDKDVALTGPIRPANYYGRYGTFDPNGQTINSPGVVALGNKDVYGTLDLMDGCTITCDTFYVGGIEMDGFKCLAQSAWYLNVTTTGYFFDSQIAYCDASSSTVVPTANPICIDRGNNIGIDFIDPQIYLLDNGLTAWASGWWATNHGGAHTRFLARTQQNGVWGCSVQQSGNHIYWASTVHNAISRASLDGQDFEYIKTGIPTPYVITVCAEHGYIWYSDYVGYTVERVDLDGTNQTSMGTASLPSGLAVDPINKKLYVAEKGNDIIYSMNFDGTSKTAVHTLAALSEPRKLTIDYINGMLYWTEDNSFGSGNRIRSGTTGGASLTTIYTGYVTDIEWSHQQNRLYMSDDQGYCWRMYGDGTNLQTVVDESATTRPFYGVGVLDGIGGGGSPGTCPDGHDDRLFVVDTGTTDGIRMQDRAWGTPADYMTGRGIAASDCKVDDINGWFYWVDNVVNAIMRCRLNGTRPEMIIDNRLDGTNTVKWICLAPDKGYLFYVKTPDNQLRRCNLDGSDERIIVNSAYTYKDYWSIDYERQSARVYWTSRADGRIVYCGYDGSSPTVLQSGLTLPSYMCIDNTNRRIIWCDNTDFKYYRCAYTGGAISHFGNGGAWPITYSPANDFMYLIYTSGVYGISCATVGPVGTIPLLWTSTGGNLDAISFNEKWLPSRSVVKGRIIAFEDGGNDLHKMDMHGEYLVMETNNPVHSQVFNAAGMFNAARRMVWAEYTTGTIYNRNPTGASTLVYTAPAGVYCLCVDEARYRVYFYVNGYGIYSMQAGGVGGPTQIVANGSLSGSVRGIWYQSTEDKIYISSSSDIIWKCDRDGGNFAVWKTGSGNTGDYPISITGDTVRQKIFWSSYTDADIHVADTDGSNHSVLWAGSGTADQIGHIVYNPADDYLYMGHYNIHHISRMRSDGANREIIYESAQTGDRFRTLVIWNSIGEVLI